MKKSGQYIINIHVGVQTQVSLFFKNEKLSHNCPQVILDVYVLFRPNTIIGIFNNILAVNGTLAFEAQKNVI